MKTAYQRAAAAIAAASILFLFASAPPASAAPKGKVHATPEAAVEAMIGALRADDLKTLLTLFGEGSDRLFLSEDPTADQNQRKEFLRLYDEKHEIASLDDKTKILIVGADPWSLPIPLAKTDTGWAFDTDEGLEEILNRRVGRNELSAIQTCLAVADAQRDYVRRDRDGDGVLEYAQKFRSTIGLQDGLYWYAAPDEPQSPIGEFVATAAYEGYGPEDTAYHGYRFRILTAQGPAAAGGAYDYLAHGNLIGGFAILAYPASYGDTGVMSFLLSHSGIVYQKDLGEQTGDEARKMAAYNPEGWAQVPEKDLQTIPEP